MEAVKHLREIVLPLKFVLVYIAVDNDLHLARARRAKLNPEMLADIENHSTEVDVKSRLPDIADLLVDGAKPVEETVATIRHTLLRT